MPNNSKELQDILYRILRILLSTQVTLWVVWRQIQRGYALFLYNAKLVRQMPNNNKQAMKAKYSNLFRNIILGTIITVSFLLLINEYFDGWAFLLEKAIGAILLYLGGKLFYHWYGYDLDVYRNEFRTYDNE